MIDRKFFRRIAATVAIAGMMLTAIGDIAGAAERLNDGDSVNGVIRTNSSTFRFRNQSRTGSPIQTSVGDEYIFNAQQGDTINISIDVEEGNLAPVLVLISSQNERQVAYDDTQNSLRYRVPAAGEYRLLVLGQNNSRGRYTLSVSGIADGDTVSQNPSSGSTDRRRQLLENEFGLRVLESCPPATGSLVVVSFPESTQTYRYCANPNRVYRAGEYTYDAIAGDLKSGSTVAQGSSSQLNDQRRQLLQDDFGLRVLDTCPAATSSLVVVSFAESTQTYRYCANPNRSYPAGEYTYNPSTRNLQAGTPGRNSQQCAVSVAGVCVVR